MRWIYGAMPALSEAGAVFAIAAASWWRVDPLAGVIIGAGYVLILANKGARNG